MDQTQVTSGGEAESEQREESRDERRVPTPRIYVASLADYNNGRLHGRLDRR